MPRISLIALLAVAWVLLLAALSPVPSEDGVSYLWMAERFAAGDWGEATSMVFPPGFPLAVAPLVALGVPVEWAAHLVNALAFGAIVFPLAGIARQLAPASARQPSVELATVILFCSGSLLLRIASEVYSEPLFLLLMAIGTLCGLRQRWWLVGAIAGAAYWLRPEGLLLAGSFFLAAPRRAFGALITAGAGVLALGVLRAALGHGFDPLPLLAFHEARDDLPGRGAFFANLIAVPGPWFEAFGIVAVLWLAALWPGVRRTLRQPAALWWQIGLQVLAVCTFVVRRRFFLSCAVPVVALAGVATSRLPRAWRAVVLMLAVAAGVLGSWRGGIDADRIAERRLGEFLAARLRPGEQIASELPRVHWFAGQRPPPPRHFDVQMFARYGEAEDVRWFVIYDPARRGSSRLLEALLEGRFSRFALPEELAELCRRRGIAVLARR